MVDPPASSAAAAPSPARSSAGAVLLALGLGLATGVALASVPALAGAARATAVAVAEPVGALWVNAIRMTVIPLVVSLLVGSVASAADARTVGRVGARAFGTFVALLTAGSVLAVLASDAALARAPLGAAAELLAAARAPDAPNAGAAPAAASVPTVGEWVVALLPTNPVAAAANGALLPLVAFTVLFAAACTRLAPASREPVVRFFVAVGDATLVLVRWVLAAAPLGVFALAVVLGARVGVAAAGALAVYVALVAALCLALCVALYVVAATAGRAPLRRFARAAAPSQAVAFSTRSSLAALPALVDGARVRLALPPTVVGFFIPLAMATFRLGASVGIATATLFAARLYGVALGPAELATVIASAVVLSFGIPGVPGGLLLVIAPVLDQVGVPPAAVGVLLAIDAIPDMFRTLTNVTAHMAAATVVARGEGRALAHGGAG